MAFPYRYLSRGIYKGIRVNHVNLRGFCLLLFSQPSGAILAGTGSLYIDLLQTNQYPALPHLTPVLQVLEPSALAL